MASNHYADAFKHRGFLSKQLSLWISALFELKPGLTFADASVSFFLANGGYLATFRFTDALRRLTYDDPTARIKDARYLVAHQLMANTGDLSLSVRKQLADYLRDPIHAPRTIFATIINFDKVTT